MWGPFSDSELYHAIKEDCVASDGQSLPVTAKIIKCYGDLELHKGSKDHPESHTDPRKRSDIGLYQKWWQQEPYFCREINLDSGSAWSGALVGLMYPLD